MGHIDQPYVLKLAKQGFKPHVASRIPKHHVIDVEGGESREQIVDALRTAAARIQKSTKASKAVERVHKLRKPAVTVSIDSRLADDADLAALLEDTAKYVAAAGDRVVGAAFQDVETAFERIQLSDIVTMAHRS